MARRAIRKSDKALSRDKLTAELKKKYEDGSSIRGIAREMGRSYSFVHRVLSESGAQLRGRGGKLSTPPGLSIRASTKKAGPKKNLPKKSPRRTEAEQLLEALPEKKLQELVQLLKVWLTEEPPRRFRIEGAQIGLIGDAPDPTANKKSDTEKTLPRTFRTIGIFEAEPDLSSRTREILRSELRGEGGEIA